jgi:PPOX class probable F420-dependent enzyme
MSRRDKIQMTDEERRAYIADAQTIIITTIGKDGTPHPMPMWFGIEKDDSIVMSTFTKSQKIRNIERDPRVALLVESGEIYNELQGVVIYGEAELVRDVAEVTEILVLVNGRSVDGMQDVNADQIRGAVAGTAPKRTGVRIRPEKIVSWNHNKLGGVY